jgi:hypothetical protein
MEKDFADRLYPSGRIITMLYMFSGKKRIKTIVTEKIV